jgi:heat shock protein HslJ
MEFEQKFLALFEKVGRYSFVAGQLALTGKDGTGALIFSK